jgi:hypothetical protein
VAPRRLERRLRAAGLAPTSAGVENQVAFANPERPGRAWVVYAVTGVATPAAALDRILSPHFDPTREVVLESATRGSYPAVSAHPATPAAVRYPGAARAEIDVRLPRPGVLVLADACHPGWRVEVDGEPAEWLCANYLTRGVELGAGSHRVEFRYESAAVRGGLALSGSTAVGLLVASAWQLRRGRR